MLDCWQASGVAAPINVGFIFEGEEENGSHGFREALASNLDWFEDASLVVISNTVWVGEGRPCLTYGMRGMVTASLVVRLFIQSRRTHAHISTHTYTYILMHIFYIIRTYIYMLRRHYPLIHQQQVQSVPLRQCHTSPPFLSQVSGPARDLHSGNDGGVFVEPMADLVQLLGGLQRPGGGVAVPGFYERVNPGLLDLAWRGLEDGGEFSAASYRAALGVPRLSVAPSNDTRCLLERRWCSPTLSIVDVRTALDGGVGGAGGAAGGGSGGSHGGGCVHDHDGDAPHFWPALPSPGGRGPQPPPPPHSPAASPGASTWPASGGGGGGGGDFGSSCYRFGPTRFSVIPKLAVGKLSLRFVPEQEASELLGALQTHLASRFAALGSGNRLELQVRLAGRQAGEDIAARLYAADVWVMAGCCMDEGWVVCR